MTITHGNHLIKNRSTSPTRVLTMLLVAALLGVAALALGWTTALAAPSNAPPTSGGPDDFGYAYVDSRADPALYALSLIHI